jgi:hypothetical protein
MERASWMAKGVEPSDRAFRNDIRVGGRLCIEADHWRIPHQRDDAI